MSRIIRNGDMVVTRNNCFLSRIKCGKKFGPLITKDKVVKILADTEGIVQYQEKVASPSGSCHRIKYQVLFDGDYVSRWAWYKELKKTRVRIPLRLP